MNSFKLVISSPEGNIYEGDVEGISLRGTEGDLAILAGHIPFVTSVVPCNVSIDDGEKIFTGKITSGILTVTKQQVTLLTGSFKFE